MSKLIIEVESETGDFACSLDQVKKLVKDGNTSGFDQNETENFSFSITKP